MEYSELLKKIYNGTFNEVLSVLNDSIHVSEYKTSGNVVIHTGFVFTNHKSNQFDLLYDLDGKRTMYQKRSSEHPIPQLNGLYLARGNYLFEGYGDHVLVQINEDGTNDGWLLLKHIKDEYGQRGDFVKTEDNFYIVIDEEDDTEEKLEHIKILSSIGNNIKYPCQRLYPSVFFFNGKEFSRDMS